MTVASMNCMWTSREEFFAGLRQPVELDEGPRLYEWSGSLCPLWGSEADIAVRPRHVRFTPEIGAVFSMAATVPISASPSDHGGHYGRPNPQLF